MCTDRFTLSSERVFWNGVRTHVHSKGKKSPVPEIQRLPSLTVFWLPVQTQGVTGSVQGLVGPVSVYGLVGLVVKASASRAADQGLNYRCLCGDVFLV